jgi:hypothetical protein
MYTLVCTACRRSCHRTLQSRYDTDLVRTHGSWKLDANYQRAFLMTYQAFMTPTQLLQMLIQRYNSADEFSDEISLKIKMRVIVILKYWIQAQV